MSRIRLVPVIIITVISLVILVVGWWAYRQFNVVNPLKANLETVQGVQNVQVESGNPGVVNVKLGQVKDLQSTYLSISHTIGGVLSDAQSVKVNIEDNRNNQLTDAYEVDIQPIVSEGIRKGNYTEMIADVQQKASSLHLTTRVTMDKQNVYVQLTQGDHYIYDVIPYSLQQGGASS